MPWSSVEQKMRRDHVSKMQWILNQQSKSIHHSGGNNKQNVYLHTLNASHNANVIPTTRVVLCGMCCDCTCVSVSCQVDVALIKDLELSAVGGASTGAGVDEAAAVASSMASSSIFSPSTWSLFAVDL